MQSNIATTAGCISFDSYIKPQQTYASKIKIKSCISFDSYIKPQLITSVQAPPTVVYLLIPTSNHNLLGMTLRATELYIF